MIRLHGRTCILANTVFPILVITYLAASSSACGQDEVTAPKVTIRRISANIYDPVLIVGFQLDGQSYDLSGRKDSPSIPARPGWLERLSIIVKNTSQKTLTAGTLQLTCPAVGNGHTLNEPRVIDQFTLGVIPTRFRKRPATSPGQAQIENESAVGPGKEAIFSLGKDFERLRAKLAAAPQPTDCTVHPVAFFFADGTMWSPLRFYKPDPNSDQGYIESNHEEFGIGKAPR